MFVYVIDKLDFLYRNKVISYIVLFKIILIINQKLYRILNFLIY